MTLEMNNLQANKSPYVEVINLAFYLMKIIEIISIRLWDGVERAPVVLHRMS